MTIQVPNMKVAGSGTDTVDREFLEAIQRDFTRAAADLASFCEHVEHNEPNSVKSAASAGDRLREIASQLAIRSEISLVAKYAARIRDVEANSLLRHVILFDDEEGLAGTEALTVATTWNELQISQIIHDRQFHPDVFGMSKVNQIRHYTFHVTKLAGLLIDAIDGDDWAAFQESRLADIAIFGVKIATVCNVKLPCSFVDQ